MTCERIFSLPVAFALVDSDQKNFGAGYNAVVTVAVNLGDPGRDDTVANTVRLAVAEFDHKHFGLDADLGPEPSVSQILERLRERLLVGGVNGVTGLRIDCSGGPSVATGSLSESR